MKNKDTYECIATDEFIIIENNLGKTMHTVMYSFAAITAIIGSVVVAMAYRNGKQNVNKTLLL